MLYIISTIFVEQGSIENYVHGLWLVSCLPTLDLNGEIDLEEPV